MPKGQVVEIVASAKEDADLSNQDTAWGTSGTGCGEHRSKSIYPRVFLEQPASISDPHLPSLVATTWSGKLDDPT